MLFCLSSAMTSKIPRKFALINALFLIVLSTILLPVSTVLGLYCSFKHSIGAVRRPLRRPNGSEGTKKRFLLTGANSRSAINLARLLHSSGHIVYAADYESLPLLSPARCSGVFKNFYRLNRPGHARERPKETTESARFGWFGGISHTTVDTSTSEPDRESLYVADIVAIVLREKINVWIPCEDLTEQNYSAIAAARNILRALDIAAVVPDDDQWAIVHSGQAEVDKFAASYGFRTPETLMVRSRHEIHRVLSKNRADSKRYSLEKVPQSTTDDSSTEDGLGSSRHNSTVVVNDSMTPPSPVSPRANGTVRKLEMSPALPMSSTNETYNYIAGLPISASEPWTLREATPNPQYRAHSLISNGRVAHFAVTVEDNTLASSITTDADTDAAIACTSARIVLSPSNRIHRLLLAFTRRLAVRFHSRPSSTTDGEPPAPTAVHVRQSFAVTEHAAGGAISSCVYLLGTEFGVDNALAALAGEGVGGKIAGAYAAVGEAVVAAGENGGADRSYYLVGESVGSSPADSRVLETGREERGEDADADPDAETVVLPSPDSTLRGLYSFPPTFWQYVVVPHARLALLRERALRGVVEGNMVLAERVIFWKEEGFDAGDPWAWWWEWHVRRPVAAVVEVLRTTLGRS